MKKVKVSVLLTIISLIVLSSCGKKDLSGVYYYEQTKPMTTSKSSSEGIQVHKLEIVASSDEKINIKYPNQHNIIPLQVKGHLKLLIKIT